MSDVNFRAEVNRYRSMASPEFNVDNSRVCRIQNLPLASALLLLSNRFLDAAIEFGLSREYIGRRCTLVVGAKFRARF